MNYLTKPCSDFNNPMGKSLGFSGKYLKPATCPHCGVSVDAPLVERASINLDNAFVLTSSCKCTACGKLFIFSCRKNASSNETAQLISIWPNSESPYTSDYLSIISPRFMDFYNQALRAEMRGDIELAAIGFRSSLEILVKDYAINELSKDVEDVSGKSLCNAIGEYLQQEDLVNTADVVRIFGNDYTHYQEKYPDKDFNILKSYMQIFMHLIETRYMIKHPPVSR